MAYWGSAWLHVGSCNIFSYLLWQLATQLWRHGTFLHGTSPYSLSGQLGIHFVHHVRFMPDYVIRLIALWHHADLTELEEWRHHAQFYSYWNYGIIILELHHCKARLGCIYVRSMKCSVPDRTRKDVQSELSSCETTQSKCVCVPSIGVQVMWGVHASSTISGTLRLAGVAIGLIASQWYLTPLRLL